MVAIIMARNHKANEVLYLVLKGRPVSVLAMSPPPCQKQGVLLSSKHRNNVHHPANRIIICHQVSHI